VEAASIAWRPLGRLLVEQGLLTDEELELALAKQQLTGKRLGETIVECGFVSRPELSDALAAQYGIELKTETGFGTGLRAQIQQRHESDRGRVVRIGLARPVQQPEPVVDPIEPEPDAASAEAQQSAELLAQLEEQWARLAAAEAQLAEREAALAQAVVERDSRQAQAKRLARRARTARAEQGEHRERRRVLTLRFIERVRERDDEIQRLHALLEDRAAEQQSARAELDAKQEQLEAALAATDERRADLAQSLAGALGERERKRAQASRFLVRLRARDSELDRLRHALDANVDEQEAAGSAAEERQVALERALAGLASDFDRRHAQAGRFARRARGLSHVVDALRHDIERLAADVRGCDAEIERLRQEHARRRAQAGRFAGRLRSRAGDVTEPPDEPAAPAGHLVFVHGADGYTLVERDGPPPERDASIELPDLDDGQFVVSARRRSPLPGDGRPCVVAERL
jgi:DNA repair exonuclease SbcCD ATPase subunit